MIRIAVTVGQKWIGEIDIHRLDGDDQADSVNTYEATMHMRDDRYQTPYFSSRAVTVKHRYGDEWPALVKTVLDAFEVTQ